jgi:hypothetical protein
MQKIDGGFLLIQAAQIAQAWTICQKKPMTAARDPIPPVAIPATPATPPPPPPPASLPEPRLADIRAEDLADLDRLAKLQAQAARAGLVGKAERDELRVVALAEHCRRIGKNPSALFAALLRRGAWSYITQAEEDAARRRLKAHRETSAAWPALGLGRPGFPGLGLGNPAPTRRPALSEDARIAREISRAVAAAGYRGDPFPQLSFPRLKPVGFPAKP